MEVYSGARNNYAEDPTRYFDFERFSKQADDFLLVPGLIDFSKLKKRDQRIVYLEFEEPNRFCSAEPSFHHQEHEALFDQVLTICPYTAEWLNGRLGVKKRIPIFFPFNTDHIPASFEKKYDVVYAGHIVSESILELVQAMSRFNYRFISNSSNPLVTDRGPSYPQKLRIMAQSRVTVASNLLYLSADHISNLRKVEGYESNEAFRFVPRTTARRLLSLRRETIAPQLKSRVFEAAFCRSLILCRRDPFGVIERYFEPEKEFVYFDDGNLQHTLKTILNNFDDYEPIIARAHQRALAEYTTERFFEKHLKRPFEAERNPRPSNQTVT